MTSRPSASQTQSLELRRYVVVLGRRWRAIVLGVLVGLLASGAFLLVQPRTASASALVNVNVISSEPFNQPREPSGLIDPQTEVQTARSSVVIARTAEQLGGDLGPGEVRASLSAEVETDATVVRITYTAPTPEEAVAGADAAAEQFLVYRGELAEQKVANISDQLTARRDLLRDDLLRVTQQLATSQDGSGRAIQAESDRQLLNLELNSLLSQLNSIRAIDTTGGTILTSAGDVGAYVSPSTQTALLVGAATGLALGLVLAMARHALDRRVRDGYVIDDLGAGPVLAGLPTSAASNPLEDVRSLREQLVVDLPAGVRVIAVVDLEAGMPAANLAVLLALAEAESGRQVNLVLPEFAANDRETLLRRLGSRHARRSDDLGRVSWTDRPHLVVTPLSPADASPDTASALTALLDEPGAAPHTTVIAVPEAAPRATRLSAVRHADRTLLAVARAVTKRPAIQAAVDDLASVDGNLAGTVLLAPGASLTPVLSTSSAAMAGR